MAKTRLVVFLMGAVLWGCTTASDYLPQSDSGPVTGIVYGRSGSPLADVLVQIPQIGQSRTGIDGRFIIPQVPLGRHILKADSVGYLPIREELSFSHLQEMVYLKMTSLEEVLDQVEKLILQEDYDKALEILGELPGGVEDRHFMEALCYWRLHKGVEAREALGMMTLKSKAVEELGALIAQGLDFSPE